MNVKKKRKQSIIYLGILLLIMSLTVGFSAFQNELFINDMMLKVRLQRDVRVSDSVISKASNAVVNVEEYNKTKLLGNVTFDSTSSYVLYKVNLTNYGNVKSGLLKFGNTSGFNVSICDSNGSNCTTNYETAICNGSNCTLGSTKEIYVKVSPTSAGTKEINLDLDIEPYVNITYENVRENTSGFRSEILTGDTYQITLTSKPEEVEVSGSAIAGYDKSTGMLTITNIESDFNIHAKYLINEVAEESYDDTNPNNYVSFNNSLFRIIKKETVNDGYGNEELRTKIIKHESIGNNIFDQEENYFDVSSLKTVINDDYYNTLSEISKSLIDTVAWDPLTTDFFGIIESANFEDNYKWMTYEQYCFESDNGIGLLNKTDYIKRVATIGNQSVLTCAIVNGELTQVPVDSLLETHPVAYLNTNTVVTGGSGTSTDPFLIDLANNGLQPNPTKIEGKELTVTGSSQELVTVSNKVGTPYYSIGTSINENNYSSIGSSSVPTASSVGSYRIYYHIPAGNGFKSKTGMIRTRIAGLTFSIAYQKGSNINAIGRTVDSCTTTGSNLTCSVTLPTITPTTGYTSVGWSTTNGDTSGTPAGTSYILSSSNNNTTLYANAVVEHNYQNTTTLAYYGTLQSAFSAAQNNQTIKVLDNVTETTSATLASGKTGIKLDLNGKTITSSATPAITNNGSLDIYSSSNNGVIEGSNQYVISNTGTLTTNNTSSTNQITIRGTSTNSNARVIYNSSTSGTVTLDTNTNITFTTGVTSNRYLIGNKGLLTVSGATLTNNQTSHSANRGVDFNSTSARLSMTSGSINTSGISILNVESTSYDPPAISVSGGIITSTLDEGIMAGIDAEDCLISITGGSITGNKGIRSFSDVSVSGFSTTISGTLAGISFSNEGKVLTISGGTITGKTGVSLLDGNEIRMSGGTVIGNTNYGIVPGSRTYITGGTVTGVKSGIQMYNNIESKYLYIGTNDSNVSTTSPLIQATGTSDSYAIFDDNDPEGDFLVTVYFYDGLLKSASGSGHTVYDGIDVTQSGYKVKTEVNDGTESAYLVEVDRIYQNTTTGIYYETLNAAFGEVLSNQTIKVLQNTTETFSATITSSKSGVKLDLNGKKITSSSSSVITNAGELDIYSTASGGIIEGSGQYVITNRGTLTTNATSATNVITIRGTSTSTSQRVINNNSGKTVTLNTNTTITFTTGVTSNRYLINNSGIINISGATLTNNATSDNTNRGIFFNPGASVNMTSGSIVTSGEALYNYASSQTTPPAISVSGGSITSTNSDAIFNNQASIVEISGGTISGTSALYNYSSGALFVTGGTLTGTIRGILNYNGTVTLGTDDSSVNQNSPIVQATASSNAYGVYNASGGTFNFYDGVIKSYWGSPFSIHGEVSDIPDGYEIKTEVNNGIESAYLGLISYEATFYYWNGTGISTVTSSCVPNGGANCSVSIPTVVTNSTGKYNGDFNNVSDNLDSISASSKYSGSSLVLDNDATFYTTYVSSVTNYYYDGSQYTSRTLSRNEMFSTNNSVTAKLGLDATTLDNYTTETGPGSSVWTGLSTAQDVNPEYESVQSAAESNYTTFYTVYTLNASFTYNSNVVSISANSGSCKITTSNTSCTVIPPSITVEEGYFAMYWLESTTSHSFPINDPIILSENGRTYTVYTDLCNYQNINTSTCYSHAHEAFEDAEDNQMIEMLNNTEESYIVIDESKHELTFDMNGRIMTVVGNGFVNNGELMIVGNGNITSFNVISMIENNGTLILNYAGTIQNNCPAGNENDKPTAILNTGTLNIVGNDYIIGTTSAIRSTAGYVNIENGNISVLTNNDMSATISGSGNTNIAITGGQISNVNNNYGSTIYWTSSGALTITGTAQVSSSTNTQQPCYTIQNASTTGGTVIVSGGTVTGGAGTDAALFLKGDSNTKIRITGGTVVSDDRSILNGTGRNEEGTIEILGGTINSNNRNAVYSYGGTVNITGGQLKSINTCIDILGGTLTLGTNDSNVSTTSPLIEATNTSFANGINISSGTFNFYDGIVKSSSGSGYAISRNPSNIPSGYQVRKELNNGVESAYLTKTLTATFYYNSNATYASTTVSSTTVTCTTDSTGSCTVTVPSVVSNSVGLYNTPYKSVANQISNMNSSSLTISNDTTFYANYSMPVTIYYPISTTARSSTIYYKNEYFMNDGEVAPTRMASVIAANDTTKTNMTFTPSVSGYDLYGFATSAGTNTYNYQTVAALAQINQSSAYAILRKGKTATIYYNSGTGDGTLSATTATTATAYQYIRCTDTDAEVNDTNYVIPSEVTGSVGKYGSAYKGLATAISTMSTVTASTASDVFYATYSGNITIYYPSSTTARSSYAYKRNEFFTSTTAMNSVIAANNTATTNFTFNSSVSGYSLYGFANAASTNTRNYSSVAALATSVQTISYAILRVGKTATVYYNSGSGNGTLSVATATTNTAYQYLRCTDTAAEIVNSSYTIPSEVAGSVGQYGNTYVNAASSVNSMTAGRTTAYTTLYAFYRDNNVTNYYYSSSAYTNRTLYRNNMFTSTTAMKTVLSTSSTGTSNYATATGPGGSVWTGLSTAQDTGIEYHNVASAAISDATTLYTVYTMNVTYEKGANVSDIGATSDSCKVTTDSTSCNVILPSITVVSGFTVAGWSTTNGATTGVSAGSSYALSTNNTTLYANAKGVKTISHSHQSQSDSNYYLDVTPHWIPDNPITIDSIKVVQSVSMISATWVGPPRTYIYAYNTATSSWDRFTHPNGEYNSTISGNSNTYSEIYIRYGGVSCDGSYEQSTKVTINYH